MSKSVVSYKTGTSKTGTSSVGANVTNRLNAIADDFNNFSGDIDEETRIRKQADAKRVDRIKLELGKLDRIIAKEAKRRIESSKAIQKEFDDKLETTQQHFKERVRETYEPLQEQLDSVVARVERLEQRMEIEKRDRELEIQRANKPLHTKFAEHYTQSEVEKVARLQRESQTLKRLGDEVFRVQQHVTAERTTREAELILMKDDFSMVIKAYEKLMEVFKKELIRKMAKVERDVEIEVNNRVASEEQLNTAINDYTQNMKEGLRLVNRASD
mmetsp:Transcript_33286/g.55009  ORF Transcript_33286/g.55009 Transcript_33286/m.55009 type:complete len:272 (-) Transcript_33286:185-1000(-)|eukprot:CAMPEP_0119320524 /NCGR_PEP_ID=MMETSP1333-20130426/52711_1 /TAXON_ID=418940 /ORGANISM="Scyphosphaera apsteinii, Strain RCC1455" /LENGTH=271 /DNA_ID=CAMNT_0007327263 /DNA_START=55 /DNA_END=870 /DNA_ORIENTATION=+